jgi:hypothetical protein
MKIRVAVLNACALPSWAANSKLQTNFNLRGPRLIDRLEPFEPDVLLVQELVTYANAKLLSRHMGWGGKIVDPETDKPKGGESCILHGDGGVATGIIWNPNVLECIYTGQSITYKGRKKRNFKETHGRFHGDTFVHLSTRHYEFEPKGVNYRSHWGNEDRYRQADAHLKNLQSPGRSIIVGVDANGDLDDPYDGFGLALARHNMLDTDQSAKKNLNKHISTAKTTWKRGGRIIRGGHTKDIAVPWQTTVRMNGVTDHNAIIFDAEVPA